MPTRKKEEKMQIADFVLEFKPKVERAISNLGDGYTPEQLLAEYDRLGGLITYKGDKVKMGSFYDHVNKNPIDKPKPVVVKKREIIEETLEEEEEVAAPAKGSKVVAPSEEGEETIEAPAPKKRATKKK